MEIQPHVLHLWTIPLVGASERHLHLLSRHERTAATQMRFKEDQDRYIVCHAAVRTILSRYLHRPAHAINYGYTAHHKPFVLQDENPNHVEFNLSHSRDYALCGVTQAASIGVDIEWITPVECSDDIAGQMFANQELVYYFGQPQPDRLRAFFRLWTLKEAFVKAIGEGMAYDWKQVEFVPDAKGHWAVSDSLWSALSFDPLPDYACAVVTSEPMRTVEHLHFTNQ